MNKQRRSNLESVIRDIRSSAYAVDRAKDEEYDSMMNLPENLSNSDRYTAMEDAVDNLGDAIGNLEEAIENIEAAIS